MANKPYTEGHYVSADGLRLYYRDYPQPADGIPVVCLPGLTRNSRDFEPLAVRLSQHRRIICPDFRGRGRSEYDNDWHNYHPARYTADLWRLLDVLDIDRVIPIGTSLGGWMAMLMHHERPERIAGVVLNDIGPETNPDGIARVVASVGRLDKVATFAEAVAQAKSFYALAFPDWNDEQWRFYTETTYRETGRGDFDLNFDRNIGRAAREGVSGLRVDAWELFERLGDLPLLLVHGALSDILTEEIVDRMRLHKPDLRVITVKNRGHAPLLDEQEAVDAISAFLHDV